jgi:hypothetical protein
VVRGGDALKRALVLLLLVACGDDSCPVAFSDGDPNGHADPLGASTTQARAGRIHGDQLPTVPSGLVTWKDGDFVLANDRVAIVIEDVGDSDLYDPWGGRPVGLARVEGGKLVEPNNFGEFFVLTGRSTVVTEAVSVINDGSDGKPAVIRARGKLHPLPFFEALTGILYNDEYADIEAAIDYELAPGSDHVEIRVRYASSRSMETKIPSTMHALMYTERTSPAVFQPGVGFDPQLQNAPYVAFVEDTATSWAYVPADGTLGSSLFASGFLGAFGPGYSIPACGTSDRIHARIVIAGPGLDPIQQSAGGYDREVTGKVTRDGAGVAGAHVHVFDGDAYVNRVITDATGAFRAHVPAAANVRYEVFTAVDGLVSSTTGTVELAATGTLSVTATENGAAVPARVQVLATVTPVAARYGEPHIQGGRIYEAFPESGAVSLPLRAGTYELVVSRGFEYDISRQNVTIAAGQTKSVAVPLDRVVDTTNVQCGDFHVHTWRSNDSGDDSVQKVRQAIADGVELPVRSDHEWVADFSSEIATLGAQKFAASIGSIELTSMELWGHMGVFPLTPRPDEPNAGAPKWQTFPTADALDTPFETLSPKVVFDAVRERPEQPVVIINHPRGNTNYFGYVGYDPATGLAASDADWDTKFTLVEVFNGSGWQSNRNGTVNDWIGLLKAGRKVSAVGSSDSHQLSGSPVGYPRTCVAVGTDDPRALTPNLVRDQLAAGHATVSGGIFVTAKLGNAGPGDTITGAGSPMNLDVLVQAAPWVDVDAIDVVVDGVTVDTIPIMPGDAESSVIRYHKQIPIQVRAAGGFVIVAAYGDKDLQPVHGGRPFGVANPIFVTP